MGRHSVVEIDPPTVAGRVPRAAGWSLRHGVGVVLGTQVVWVALSSLATPPRWLFWSVTVVVAALVVVRVRVLDRRVLLTLLGVATGWYVLRQEVVSPLVDATLGRTTAAFEVTAWMAHPGAVVLGTAVAALVDRDVAARLRALGAEHRPALPVPPLRAACAVAAGLLLAVCAVMPVARSLGDVEQGGSSTAGSSTAGSSTAMSSTATVSTALGCEVDASTGVAGFTCTRDALIARVCDLDVDGATASETSNGMTVWLDGGANMVKFSSNFSPPVPFTEGGVECVGHTVENGYPAAVAHDLDLDAADWDALVRSGALPVALDTRIDRA